MRVGFDVSPLQLSHSLGLARVVRGAVESLERRGHLEVVRLAPAPGEVLRAWRQGPLARASTERGLAGVHSFVSAFPLRGPGRRVQTVHELPWRHGVRENAGLRHRLWAGLGPIRADLVLCGTEHVARDLRRRRLSGAGKVRVVPWGVDPAFADEPPPGTVDEVVLRKYRLPEDPLVLCLGAVRPKKNLEAVIRGLAVLHARSGAERRPRLHLVVTGRETPQLRRDLALASRLGLGRWISTPGEVAESDLPSLLRLAAVVPVLSRSEGFGLPALEALASGTPVLVPPGSAQAEVAGELAFRVDPADPAAVAAGLERAASEREELRYRLGARARELTWDRWSETVEGLWQALAAGRAAARG